MIPVEHFKLFLRAALPFIEEETHTSLNVLMVELDSMKLTATDGHALIHADFNTPCGAGSYGISWVDCKKLLEVLPDEGSLVVVGHAGKLTFVCGNYHTTFTRVNTVSDYCDYNKMMTYYNTPDVSGDALIDPKYFKQCVTPFDKISEGLRVHFKGAQNPLFMQHSAPFILMAVIMPMCDEP